MLEIMDILSNINKTMKDFGFETDVNYGNDNFKITGKEVIIKMPYVLKLTIPKSDFEDATDDSISRVVSNAISQAVSVNK